MKDSKEEPRLVRYVDPNKLHGRDLALWLAGRASIVEDANRARCLGTMGGAEASRLAASEILDLCDRPKPERRITPGAARAAANRDAISAISLLLWRVPGPQDGTRFAWQNQHIQHPNKTMATIIGEIIEHSGTMIS